MGSRMEEKKAKGNLSTKIPKPLLKRFKVKAFEKYSDHRDWLRRGIIEAINLWLEKYGEEKEA